MTNKSLKHNKKGIANKRKLELRFLHKKHYICRKIQAYQMKNVIRITKEFHFEMAHSLDDHQGKCRNIHGHSYQLMVTIKGTPKDEPGNSENGMLIDFGHLKSMVNENIVDKLDHSLVLWEGSPYLVDNEAIKHTNLKIVSYQPTCENLVIEIAKIIKTKLPDGISLHSVFLRETASSYAEWFASDNI